MLKKYFLFTTLVILVSSNVSSKPLTLEELTKLVLKNNFDIQISNLDLEKSKGEFIKAEGEFDSKLSFNYTNDVNDTPLSSTLDGGGAASSLKASTRTLSLGLDKTFSTGTKINLPYTYNLVDSESSFRILEVTHEPTLSLSLSQPLIKIWESGYFTKSLDSSENNWKKEVQKNKKKIVKTLMDVYKKYFKYLELKENHQIMENNVAYNKRNLTFIMKKNKLGKASKVEVLESGSALRKTTERMIKNKLKIREAYNELKLKVFTDINAEFEPSHTKLMSETLEIEKDLEKLYKVALEKRPEARERELELNLAKSSARFSNIDLYPTVEFSGEIESKGIQDSHSNGLDEVKKGEFISSNIGLTVSQDLNRYSQKGNHQIQLAKLKQAQLKYDQFRMDLKSEIQISKQSLLTQQQVINSLKISKDAEAQKWKYYQKQYKLGRISSYEVSKYQESMEKVNLELNKAVYRYENDIIKYYQTAGILLDKLPIQ